ncbi:chemotaxis protein [Subtercola boreus]|uniref:Chemotaxis protein n=1 Tax=Subtercola boreus TaxID=120213 RepID=A0A3E0W0V2_9MICO|nr:DUF3375 domain-containing protein [Subtercola boreus]RFA15600.1 chemotaxis protein [Subtercola boreus]
MPALAAALSYKRLIDENPALQMLRKDNVAVIAAVVAERLGQPGTRVPADDLHELIDADLEELRDHFDLSNRRAKAYCDEWRNAGILIRRPATDARGETYELSAAGFDAIRLLNQLQAPRSTVTESRLVSLAATLQQLAIDTDPDSTRRLDALEREKRRIDEEIERIRGGDFTVLDTRRATERVTDVLLQAQALPADFARVRALFGEINRELRESILNTDESQGAVLDDVFRGVDLIESSDEGRTFSAFSALIRDPERSAAFEADVSAILGREFAGELSVEARRGLRGLIREMKDGSREVQGILTEFARGLRRYVHSQEFQRDRALRGILQEALAAAVAASKRVKPYAEIGGELELSAMRFSSVGELSPFDPSDFDTGAELADDVPGVVDFAALAAVARESEIDFTELAANVNETLAAMGPVSVGALLVRHPASQGVASVIGLLSLATQQGERRAGAVEEVVWHGLDGVERRAEIELHLFTGEVAG